MLNNSRFSLNRIICPELGLEDFFKLTAELGLRNVELRNDLPGEKIVDQYSPEEARALADRYDIHILTINAIQKFNLGTLQEQIYEETREMLALAAAIGCKALVLCPTNNDKNDTRTPEEAYRDTVAALQKLAPLFEKHGITGLVEALGFEVCSLRSKETAIKAIQESGSSSYQLVHDTFHHYFGPDEDMYPDYTGLVHISGVEADLPENQIQDEHRILIGSQDMIHNKEQIQRFERKGYTGIYSFEPFSPEIHSMSPETLTEALKESLNFMIA
jgi:2-keto-myo-inositol isomerase